MLARRVTTKEAHVVRNVVRGMLNLVLAAAATWLANYITERVFGPEEENVHD